MKKSLFLGFALAIAIMSCKKENDTVVDSTTKSITLISSASEDGFIVNSTPKAIKLSDKTLDMGWTGGASMRSFLSFDVSSILPTTNETLVIESVDLKVYEQNTNMLPFTEGTTRVVETYLIDYGTLDSTDFNKATIANCGVITNTGSIVLKEYPLSVTLPVSNYLTQNTTATKVQFRLQFTNNQNVPTSSTLCNAMWRIYSGEDQGANINPYRPILVIKYHYKSK